MGRNFESLPQQAEGASYLPCAILQMMKLTLQTQLFPDREQQRKLLATMAAFNAAADWLAGEACKLQTASKVRLQQLYYRQLREQFSLSAQMAIRCTAQVCEAFSRERTIRPRFKKYASIPYDQRLMSFKGLDRVSLLTLAGRVIVPFILKALSGRESRGKKNTNHTIARRIVEKATDTQRGIALEHLTQIRTRTRFRQNQRDRMSKWAFAELRYARRVQSATGRSSGQRG